jgi:hypothetical protein
MWKLLKAGLLVIAFVFASTSISAQNQTSNEQKKYEGMSMAAFRSQCKMGGKVSIRLRYRDLGDDRSYIVSDIISDGKDKRRLLARVYYFGEFSGIKPTDFIAKCRRKGK